MSKTKLFCIPFAGGSKHSFRSFCEYSQTDLEIIPLELPGRAGRIREALSSDLNHLINDLFQQVTPHVKEPYAFYGHSVGATLTFLLTKHIVSRGLNPPSHLFLTGRAGPSIVNTDKSKMLGHLSPEKFLEALIAFDGVPEAILSDKGLLNYFLEIARADIVASDSYQYQVTEPLDIPLTVRIGKEEDLSLEEALEWQKETKQPLDFEEVPGDHFFPFDMDNKFIDYIVAQLNNKVETKISLP